LVHGVIGRAVFEAVWPLLSSDAAIAAALLVTLAGAAVINVWVERPLLAVGHRVARRLRPKTAQAIELVDG
jgi:peptidoglycan/LPS O-acetylase OafA/YrhL